MEQEKSAQLLNDTEAAVAAGSEVTDALRRELRQDVPIPMNYANYSLPAKHGSGVFYQGEFETPSDGTAQAVRLHARALADTGIPLLLRSFSGMVVNAQGVAEPVCLTGLPPEVENEVGALTTTDIAVARPSIKHLVIRSAEHLRQVIVPRGAIPLLDDISEQIKLHNGIYANSIVYSVWERDRIDPAVAKMLARVRQCWVPSEHNAKLLRDSGVPAEHVHVVPHPYKDNDPIHACTRRPASLHCGSRRFYAIGRWEPRKGFDKLVRAFLLAFSPEDDVHLTIKYSGSGRWPQYQSPEECLTLSFDERAVNGWKPKDVAERIHLIDGRVTRSKIVQLHFENNIYVSSSHGEAWNLSAFDAKLAGNTLVYVPWGGVCDFAESSDIAIPCKLGPVHESYNWEHGSQWADYTIPLLARGLRCATVPSEFRRPGGLDRFSMAAVGRQMRDLVDSAFPALE